MSIYIIFFVNLNTYLTNEIGSRNNTLPNVSRHQHLAKKKLLKIPGIFGVKKIEIHENYVPGQFFNDIAIMTMTKPFEFDRKTKDKTKKGKLQTKTYITKSKVFTYSLRISSLFSSVM